jgi:hypothetical protein
VPKQQVMNVCRVICLAFLVVFSILVKCEVKSSSYYSIQFYTNESEIQEITYQITINEIPGDQTNLSFNSPGSRWIDFVAAPGDTLSVYLVEFGSPNFSYVIYNGANGQGSKIYDSTSTTFTPLNTCTSGTCIWSIYGASSFRTNTANVYVNNMLVLSDYDGNANQEFNVNVNDSIRIVFDYVSGVSYYFLSYNEGSYNYWQYDAFGQNTFVYNPVPNVSRSPFGGQLYPITNEQSSAFAITIGAGNSTWIPLTLPFI